jgi:hypothetical protein
MKQTLRVFAAAIVLAGGLAAPALAQIGVGPNDPVKKPPRPVHGLFGGAQNDATRNLLDFTLSSSLDFNDSITPAPQIGPADVFDPRYADQYLFSRLTGTFGYTHPWKRATLRVVSANTFQYYPDSSQLSGLAYGGNVSFNANPNTRVAVHASQSFEYSPFYGFGMYSNPNTAENFRLSSLYAVSLDRNLVAVSEGGVSAKLARRVTLSGDASYRYLGYLDRNSTYTNNSLGARISTSLTRSFGVHAGYTHYKGTLGTVYVEGSPVAQHDIDVGIDFNKTLPLGRKTTATFAMGSTAYTLVDRVYFRALANASLSTALGRTWTAGADYRRGMQWIQGIAVPLYGNFFGTNLGGFAGERIEIRLRGGYSDGDPNLSGGAVNMHTYTGVAHMRYALTEKLGITGQYFYYHYKFGQNPIWLPRGMASMQDRQTLSIGFDVWLPVIR